MYALINNYKQICQNIERMFECNFQSSFSKLILRVPFKSEDKYTYAFYSCTYNQYKKSIVFPFSLVLTRCRCHCWRQNAIDVRSRLYMRRMLAHNEKIKRFLL